MAEERKDLEDQVIEDNITEEEQLDEFKASGEDSSVADPVAPKGGSAKANRKADKEGGDKGTQEVPVASTPGQSKSQLMASMMVKMGGMNKAALQAMYDGMAKQPKAGVAPSMPMPKLSVKEDLGDLFGSEELSEQFMEKAETIFEAAVNARLAVEVEKLQEQFDDKLAEATKELEEQMTTKVDEYLSYAAEEWMKENEVAIESALKVEIAENLMNGMKQVFAENYIDVPEEKLDVFEELAAKVDELEEKLNEEVKSKMELTREVEIHQRASVFAEVAESLTDVQADKFAKLCEGIEADDTEAYQKKLEMIKENYFTTKVVTEEAEEEPLEDATENTVAIDPEMSRYAQAISRTVKR